MRIKFPLQRSCHHCQLSRRTDSLSLSETERWGDLSCIVVGLRDDGGSLLCVRFFSVLSNQRSDLRPYLRQLFRCDSTFPSGITTTPIQTLHLIGQDNT